MDPKIEEIAKKYDFKLIVLFGSYGTPSYNPIDSDIDIAVLPNGDANSVDLRLKEIYIDFALYFKKGKIDIINLITAPVLLKQQVSQHGTMLYQQAEGVYDTYMDYYQKLFMENIEYFKEKHRKNMEEIEEALKKWETQ